MSIKRGNGNISGSRRTPGAGKGESDEEGRGRGAVWSGSDGIKQLLLLTLVVAVVVTWMPEVVGLNTFSLPR